jgi:RsiW-degrading membrane proteinase PrsW (M82 family)
MRKLARQDAATRQRTVETRAVEFLTVGWMVSMMTTLVCLAVFAILRFYMSLRGDSEPLALMAGLALFAGSVTGVLTLALAAIVVRKRREKPPRGVVWFAVAAGTIPLVIVLVESLASAM